MRGGGEIQPGIYLFIYTILYNTEKYYTRQYYTRQYYTRQYYTILLYNTILYYTGLASRRTTDEWTTHIAATQPVVGCTRTPIGQGQVQLRNDRIMKQRLCALGWWARQRGSERCPRRARRLGPRSNCDPSVWQLQRSAAQRGKWPVAARC